MAFIRIKRIKGNEYAYIVENKWKKKKVKQKTKKYLGRVYRFDVKDSDFFSFYNVGVEDYISKNSKDQMIKDLIRWELVRHGFIEEGGVLINGGCKVDISKKKVLNDKVNNIALAFHEGYMLGDGLSRLFKFEASVQEEAYDLAKLFVESGFQVTQEVFVGIFQTFNVKFVEEEY